MSDKDVLLFSADDRGLINEFLEFARIRGYTRRRQVRTALDHEARGELEENCAGDFGAGLNRTTPPATYSAAAGAPAQISRHLPQPQRRHSRIGPAAARRSTPQTDPASTPPALANTSAASHSQPPPRPSLAPAPSIVRPEGLGILGVERFVLVGHSLGGAVAAAVAERMPEKVDALVLLAPVGFGRIHLAEACCLPVIRNLVRAALPWALCSRTVVTTAYLTMVTNGRPPTPDIIDRVTGNGHGLVDGTRKGVHAIANAGRRAQASGRAKLRYDGPVTAVWGDGDRLVDPSHRRGLLDALPQAEIEVWGGMGHHPIGERLEELAKLILRQA
jgi:Serine aminopeptidase, S33